MYIGIGLVVFLLVALIALARWSQVRVQTVEISGVSTISTDAMQAYVAQELSGDYMWVFPRNNIALFSTKALADALRTQFPRIETIAVHRKSFSDLSVAITERAPSGRWCGKEASVISVEAASSSPASTFIEQCILLDITGLAYEHESAGDGMDALPAWYGPLAGDGVMLPAQFLTPKDFASLRALAEAIAGQVNAGALISVSADAEGSGRVSFANGFSLLFKTTDDAGSVMDHISAGLSSPIFSGRSTDDFQYLDVRFGDRLYYKLHATTTPR